MDLKTVLQILNVLFLGLFGAASGKMINEWRQSREERHRAEIASLASEAKAEEAIQERLKATDQFEIEKRDLQIAKLVADVERLTLARTERIEGLEEQIKVLKSLTPAEVASNMEGLKKLHEHQLLVRQQQMDECQSELLKFQTILDSNKTTIEQLQAKRENVTVSIQSDVCLQSILTQSQRQRLKREREKLSSATNVPIPWLVSQLRGNSFADFSLRLVGKLFGDRILEYATASEALATMGDSAAVAKLEELLVGNREQVRLRALLTLQRINTEDANEALKREGYAV